MSVIPRTDQLAAALPLLGTNVWGALKRIRESSTAEANYVQGQIDQHQREMKRARRDYTRKGSAYSKKPVRANLRVGGFIGQTVKYYDTSGIFNVAATQYIHNITPNGIAAPAQGVGPEERIGRKLTVVSILVDAMIYSGATAAVPEAPAKDVIYTLYVIKDKQTNGTVAVDPAFVMENTPSMPRMNMENTDRFQVVAKKTVKVINHVPVPSVGANAPTAMTGAGTGHLRCYRKMKMQVLMRLATEGNNNVQDNGLFCILHQNVHASAADTKPAIYWSARARFVG